jgi:2,5-furandicarboxylate decarboxylase 1
MGINSFRDYLEILENDGQLIRINDPVDTKFEISAYVQKTCHTNGPALCFENVKGFSTKVIAGVFSNRKRVVTALESSESDVLERYMKGLSNPLRAQTVSSGYCKEKIMLNNEVDLLTLPHLIYSKLDGGPFITAGVVITKDCDTGIRNAGMYRCQVKGKRKLSIMGPASQHVMAHLNKSESKNKSLEVAIAIGVDPAIILAAGAKLPYGLDELEVAGSLRGSPLNLCKCETVDLEVPATSEIVIEGRIPPKVREDEGPFGEFTGYYAAGVQKMPIIEISAITQRKDALYHAINTGLPPTENHVIKEIPWEATTFSELKRKFPEVIHVHYPEAGGTKFVVFVSIKQRYKGLARNVLGSLLGSPAPPKIAIVVDEDIDVHDLTKVVWALATRFQPAEDLMIISNMPGTPLDPSTGESRLTSVVGIDATKPFGMTFPDVVEVPGADKIPDLRKYFIKELTPH